jgi:hypothetical protein
MVRQTARRLGIGLTEPLLIALEAMRIVDLGAKAPCDVSRSASRNKRLGCPSPTFLSWDGDLG